jgi:hypothetical protein
MAGGGDIVQIGVDFEHVKDFVRMVDTVKNARRLARQNG